MADRRGLVGVVTWAAATLGGAVGMRLVAPYQPVEVQVGLVIALAVIGPFLAMRFVPSDHVRTLKSTVSAMLWAGAIAGGVAVALYSHWHTSLAVANDSGQDIELALDGHVLGTLQVGTTGTYKVPTNASEIIARHGEAVVDHDQLDEIQGTGTWLFDVGGKGCFERRTVTYGRPMFGLGGHTDPATRLRLDDNHHALRVKVDFVWHAESGVSVGKGESSATRDVLTRCGVDD